MPTSIYDTDDTLKFKFNFSIGDFELDSWNFYSSAVAINVPANERFSRLYDWPFKDITESQLSSYDKYLRIVTEISLASPATDEYLYYDILGLDMNIHGLFFEYFLRDSLGHDMFYNLLTNKKPIYAEYRSITPDGSKLSSGSINLNNITLSSANSLDIKLDINPVSASTRACEVLRITLYYPMPVYTGSTPFTKCLLTCGFSATDSFVYGDFITGNSSSNNQDDYNQNVEVELGNIQTGINNVINSVVQMGNQAWQGAQQTVQAVTQMTQQLNTAIDQQRQDILDGLGLLGDDIGSSLTSVKSEITSIGTSITNKIESTTETITNTIENKVDEVTSAVQDVKQSVTEVKQSITDLPNKLKEMLTGFFVPNEQTINSKYSEFETLLSDRFGLIYQSADIIHDFAESFQSQAVMTADTGGIITMPQVTVSLAGTPFTFGGYEVDIIPDGFETLQQMCRLAVSMVCTVVFINMLKSKLEWILR